MMLCYSIILSFGLYFGPHYQLAGYQIGECYTQDIELRSA